MMKFYALIFLMVCLIKEVKSVKKKKTLEVLVDFNQRFSLYILSFLNGA